MAFSFVVETGIGDSDATAYADVEFVDDYAEANAFQSSDWTALTDDQKERLIVWSSRYLDRMVKWNGHRVDQDSGLRWPRCGVYDADGFLIAEDVIPGALKEAVAEMALYLMSDDWTSPQATKGFKEIKVDVIDIKLDASISQRGNVPPTVIAILGDLGEVNTGRRPAFKKIIRH